MSQREYATPSDEQLVNFVSVYLFGTTDLGTIERRMIEGFVGDPVLREGFLRVHRMFQDAVWALDDEITEAESE